MRAVAQHLWDSQPPGLGLVAVGLYERGRGRPMGARDGPRLRRRGCGRSGSLGRGVQKTVGWAPERVGYLCMTMDGGSHDATGQPTLRRGLLSGSFHDRRGIAAVVWFTAHALGRTFGPIAQTRVTAGVCGRTARRLALSVPNSESRGPRATVGVALAVRGQLRRCKVIGRQHGRPVPWDTAVRWAGRSPRKGGHRWRIACARSTTAT